MLDHFWYKFQQWWKKLPPWPWSCRCQQCPRRWQCLLRTTSERLGCLGCQLIRRPGSRSWWSPTPLGSKSEIGSSWTCSPWQENKVSLKRPNLSKIFNFKHTSWLRPGTFALKGVPEICHGFEISFLVSNNKNTIFQRSWVHLVKQIKKELVASLDTGKGHILKDFDSLVLDKTKWTTKYWKVLTCALKMQRKWTC